MAEMVEELIAAGNAPVESKSMDDMMMMYEDGSMMDDMMESMMMMDDMKMP